MSKKRHVPQRSCAACREKRPKRELTRIVRTPQGAVMVDQRGRIDGRGAYLCSQPACWVSGVTRGRIAHALKTTLDKTDKDNLLTHAPGRENWERPGARAIRT